MTKATLKSPQKRAQRFSASGHQRNSTAALASNPSPLPYTQSPAVDAKQKKAMRLLIQDMHGVFPKFAFPSHTIVQPANDDGLLKTLERIARHLRERQQQYQEFYSHFNSTIGTNLDAKIAEHSKTFEEALDAVNKLPAQPTEPEVVHDVLRKVSAAAHALIFVQREEITRLQNEAQRLENPDKKEEVVARLQRLWRTNGLKYDNPPGYHSISVGEWIEKNLVQSRLFTEEEINLIPTAVYRHVDKKLYQAIADARRKNSTVKSKKTEYNIEPSFKRPQRLAA